jgi:DUF177 domain-containing protein
VKIRIDDITAEAKEIAFAESESETNRVLAQGPIREYRLEGPISVTVSFYRAGTELFFSGDLRTQTLAVCARCTEEFEAENDRPFRFVLSPKAVGYDVDSALQGDDLEFSLYEGEDIDLSPLIREQILLALPTRPLCREDCRGLCPQCGANLNLGPCGCRAETGDPRLEAIRSLKLKHS